MAEAKSTPGGRADRRRSAGLLLWAAGTLLAAVSSWWLWKIYGRQLMAAPGEILLTMSRPEAVEPPYPVDDLGGQWGLLMLGELPVKYGRMMALLLGWWLGAVLLFGLAWTRLRGAGLSLAGRLMMSAAGAAVFGAGLLFLQAGFRAGVNFERMADAGDVDPFVLANLLPLSLATRACFLLAVASILLAAASGVGFRKPWKSGYLAPRHRVLPFRIATVVSLVALAVPAIYSFIILRDTIPELLAQRLENPEIEALAAEKINALLQGLRFTGVVVQLGGLLWIVAAWVAPGRAVEDGS